MKRRQNQDQDNGNDYLNFKVVEENTNEQIPSDQNIQLIRMDRDEWARTLHKYQHPGNRRRILYVTLNMSNDQLREMTGWGKSTITNLVRKFDDANQKYSWQNKMRVLSQFGIMVRGTFSLITSKRRLLKLKWDDILFRQIEDYASIDVQYFVKQINIALENHKRYIYGYVLIIGDKKLDLRFERRDGIIIIELTNPDFELFQVLAGILKNTPIEWKFLFTPTIYQNKNFLIFVGNANERQMEELLNDDFCWSVEWYSLIQTTKNRMISKKE
jgi:hypothetical protein